MIFGLALVWASVKLSRFQCVLEKEYFCSSIPNGFPEGLASILFVVTNLEVINSTIFSSPSLASVASLALANSGITKIEPGAFHAFQSLSKLSLYQNSLTAVTASWLSNPGRLENLTAAQNLIAKIGPASFSGFSNLTTLNLANNRIHQIASGSFKDLPKLTLLDLSGNNLTSLTRNVFSGLMPPVMKLGGNPWNCSCEIQDFGLFLQELINASLLEDAASVVCRSPPSLDRVPVWNISDLNCTPAFYSSAYGSTFHTVGLPALLACLGTLAFGALLLLFSVGAAQLCPPGCHSCSVGAVECEQVSSLSDEREVALAILGLHHDAEKSTSEDIWQSSSWSALCPPCRILHREQSEGETESTYEYPSPRASTTQLDTVFPLTKKTTTQLILKDWDGRLGVMETLETKMMVDHRVSVHPPRCMSIRGLSEEILDAKMPLQALTTGDDGVGSSSNASSNATGLNSCYDAPIGPLFRIDENLLLLELSASDRSYSEVIYPGVQGDGYEEVATITSTCPLVQKMLQIDFPLLAEEENASWSGERKEAGPAAKLVKERSVWLTQESSSGSVGEKVA
ncbi:uncharacterized protein LOC133373984 [Rhineura floridana]|uniref:uncharacterized protein LOC133373984 n=1 Tax=Rhineura floridana TaxID=261503 RepID=UPI002AC86F4B|nr:uncharacterized protein LOC133373984 [Rhineura floridana]